MGHTRYWFPCCPEGQRTRLLAPKRFRTRRSDVVVQQHTILVSPIRESSQLSDALGRSRRGAWSRSSVAASGRPSEDGLGGPEGLPGANSSRRCKHRCSKLRREPRRHLPKQVGRIRRRHARRHSRLSTTRRSETVDDPKAEDCQRLESRRRGSEDPLS
jgi:hypothetical protein